MAQVMQQMGMMTVRSWSPRSVRHQGLAVAAAEDLVMATTEDEDTGYFRRGVGFLLILAVVFVLSQLVGLAAIYMGAEYKTPSWNEHSVPPPKLY
jgi:hypothetical protein